MAGFPDTDRIGTSECAPGENLVQFAQILKSNGNAGELVLGFRDIYPEDIDLKEPVFIYFDGLPVPFFFEKFRLRGNSKAVARLTGISTPEDVAEVTGKAIYADWGEPDELSLEQDGLEALVGWRVLDGDSEIGTVTSFVDIPENPCIEVRTQGGELMIPLHDDLVSEINQKDKILRMSLPSGLLEI